MTTQRTIDFEQIRRTLVRAVKATTGLECLVAEGEGQGNPRPGTNPAGLAYFSVKLTVPSAKVGGGDDSRNVPGTTKWVSGGQRRMTASFQCYATEHEEAYSHMALLQSALMGELLPASLGAAGVAVWTVGNLVDLSQLLNTGYEGRSQMDVTFGVASNLTEDLGEMDTFPTTGTVDTGQGTNTVTGTLKKN